MKSKKNASKSNSYSTMNQNKKNMLINLQKSEFKNIFELNYKNLINGGREDQKIQNILNEEMMKTIKNTVDDNLKKMFNFSYENFLSKESEQESKDYYYVEKEKYLNDSKKNEIDFEK